MNERAIKLASMAPLVGIALALILPISSYATEGEESTDGIGGCGGASPAPAAVANGFACESFVKPTPTCTPGAGPHGWENLCCWDTNNQKCGEWLWRAGCCTATNGSKFWHLFYSKVIHSETYTCAGHALEPKACSGI